jgi:hypothetical protein
MGRTWYARAAYHRGTSYVVGIVAPVRNDGVGVETGGFLNHRVDVLISAGYALGSIAGPTSRGHSYNANARLRIGLRREAAAFVEGLFYDYAFDRSVLLPELPSHFTRNGVRAGLTMWLPVRSR